MKRVYGPEDMVLRAACPTASHPVGQDELADEDERDPGSVPLESEAYISF
jgi:hypothetical protein